MDPETLTKCCDGGVDARMRLIVVCLENDGCREGIICCRRYEKRAKSRSGALCILPPQQGRPPSSTNMRSCRTSGRRVLELERMFVNSLWYVVPWQFLIQWLCAVHNSWTVGVPSVVRFPQVVNKPQGVSCDAEQLLQCAVPGYIDDLVYSGAGMRWSFNFGRRLTWFMFGDVVLPWEGAWFSDASTIACTSMIGIYSCRLLVDCDAACGWFSVEGIWTTGCGGCFGTLWVDKDQIYALLCVHRSVMAPSISSDSIISLSRSSGSSMVLMVFSMRSARRYRFFSSCPSMLCSEAITISVRASFAMMSAALFDTFVRWSLWPLRECWDFHRLLHPGHGTKMS